MFKILRFTQCYDPKQDRISFTAQNAEGEVILLWLTQRLVNRLTKALTGWLDDELKILTAGREVPPGLHTFEQSAAQAVRKPQRAVKPEQLQAEVLLTSIGLARRPHGYLLTFKWDDSGAATVFMNGVELRQFMSILSRQFDKAGWPRHAWPDWLAAKPGEVVSSSPILLH